MPNVDRSDRESRRKYATGWVSYYLKLNDMPGRLNFSGASVEDEKKLRGVVSSLDWLSRMKFDFRTHLLAGALIYVFGRKSTGKFSTSREESSNAAREGIQLASLAGNEHRIFEPEFTISPGLAVTDRYEFTP
jgi:hypothetical protein